MILIVLLAAFVLVDVLVVAAVRRGHVRPDTNWFPDTHAQSVPHERPPV